MSTFEHQKKVLLRQGKTQLSQAQHSSLSVDKPFLALYTLLLWRNTWRTYVVRDVEMAHCTIRTSWPSKISLIWATTGFDEYWLKLIKSILIYLWMTSAFILWRPLRVIRLWCQHKWHVSPSKTDHGHYHSRGNGLAKFPSAWTIYTPAWRHYQLWCHNYVICYYYVRS